MLKAAIALHAGIQCFLPGMPKRGVAKIMCQRNTFGQVFIQLQGASYGTRHLCDFNRVRQPGAKQVAFMVHKYLGFVFQPPECSRVDDPVAVTLIFRTVGGCGFVMPAPS